MIIYAPTPIEQKYGVKAALGKPGKPAKTDAKKNRTGACLKMSLRVRHVSWRSKRLRGEAEANTEIPRWRLETSRARNRLRNLIKHVVNTEIATLPTVARNDSEDFWDKLTVPISPNQITFGAPPLGVVIGYNLK
jgi:hypothetical protein